MAAGKIRLVQKAGKKTKKGPLGPVARKQVAKIANRAVHRANQDKKAVITKTVATLDFNAVYQQLTLIATGTGSLLRDSGAGDNIFVKRIMLRGALIAGTRSASFRLIVFRWLPNMTIDPPTTGDVLAGDGTANGVYNDLVTQNRQKLKIYWDRLIEVDPVNRPRVNFARSIKINHRIEYDASDATGNTGTNQIFFMLQTTDSAATLPSYEYTASVYFEEN